VSSTLKLRSLIGAISLVCCIELTFTRNLQPLHLHINFDLNLNLLARNGIRFSDYSTFAVRWTGVPTFH
jgi:hypothetical protein